MDTKTILFTAGYQGYSQDDFVSLVQAKGIKKIIDVRAIPHSRKKGFSKKSLEARLRQSGLDYEHIQSLGTPDEIRLSYRQNGNFDLFKKLYLQAISDKDEIIKRLAVDIYASACCLLCFEKDPLSCHRSVVAEEIVKRSKLPVQIAHL